MTDTTISLLCCVLPVAFIGIVVAVYTIKPQWIERVAGAPMPKWLKGKRRR